MNHIIRRTLQEQNIHAKVFVASNPEFLREGWALYDCFYPDRIIIGAEEPEAVEMLRRLYRPLLEQTFEPLDVIPKKERRNRPSAFNHDRSGQRRDDQVCGECLFGTEDQFHQRNCGVV